MTIKKGTKVKFSESAKHLKSYDADAVGVVKVTNSGKVKVLFEYGDNRPQKAVWLTLKMLERYRGSKHPTNEEKQITLQPGDWCGDELTEEQYSEVFDCFVNAGALVYEVNSFRYWKNETASAHHVFAGFCHYMDPDSMVRHLTYSQIINATNAKPKKDTVEETEVIEAKPTQKTLDAALCELSTLNEKIAVLTKQRNEVQEYIKQRHAEHGISVEFDTIDQANPELNITDWRDLLPGDVIEVFNVKVHYLTENKYYQVREVDLCDDNQPVKLSKDDDGNECWIDKDLCSCRLICRPS